jgi:hypothetical protein
MAADDIDCAVGVGVRAICVDEGRVTEVVSGVVASADDTSAGAAACAWAVVDWSMGTELVVLVVVCSAIEVVVPTTGAIGGNCGGAGAAMACVDVSTAFVEVVVVDVDVDVVDVDIDVTVVAAAPPVAVLGTAVHLFVPSVVINAPEGRLAFVAIVSKVQPEAIPVAEFKRR